MLPLRHTADFKSCKKEDEQPVLNVGGFKSAEDIGRPLTAEAEGGIMDLVSCRELLHNQRLHSLLFSYSSFISLKHLSVFPTVH